MIKGVIFDCFGVLYISAGSYFYQTAIPHYDEIEERLHELGRQCDLGFITQADLVAQVAELSGLDKTYVARHIQGKLRRNDALLSFSQSLRPERRVGLLSNIGAGTMEGYFSKPEQHRLFDAVVLSGEAGMVKPYPEIYCLTAERLGVQPGECVMIDDSEENCAGADAAGMQAILYRSNRQVIDELNRLLAE